MPITVTNSRELDDDGLPINVYMNVSVTNQSTTSAPYPLQYQQVRVTPFISQVEKYCLSIIRFYCDTPSLPIWIDTIKYESTDPNETIYSCTLSWPDPSNKVTYNYQKYMEFSP